MLLLAGGEVRVGEASNPGLANAGSDSPDVPWLELEAESDDGSAAEVPWLIEDEDSDDAGDTHSALDKRELLGEIAGPDYLVDRLQR